MTNNINPKATAQFVLGCIITIAGLILLFVGCFTPPSGEIHSSLLVAFGEISTFAGALIVLFFAGMFPWWVAALAGVGIWAIYHLIF